MKIYCHACMCEHESIEGTIAGIRYDLIECPKSPRDKPFMVIPPLVTHDDPMVSLDLPQHD